MSTGGGGRWCRRRAHEQHGQPRGACVDCAGEQCARRPPPRGGKAPPRAATIWPQGAGAITPHSLRCPVHAGGSRHGATSHTNTEACVWGRCGGRVAQRCSAGGAGPAGATTPGSLRGLACHTLPSVGLGGFWASLRSISCAVSGGGAEVSCLQWAGAKPSARARGAAPGCQSPPWPWPSRLSSGNSRNAALRTALRTCQRFLASSTGQTGVSGLRDIGRSMRAGVTWLQEGRAPAAQQQPQRQMPTGAAATPGTGGQGGPPNAACLTHRSKRRGRSCSRCT